MCSSLSESLVRFAGRIPVSVVLVMATSEERRRTVTPPGSRRVAKSQPSVLFGACHLRHIVSMPTPIYPSPARYAEPHPEKHPFMSAAITTAVTIVTDHTDVKTRERMHETCAAMEPCRLRTSSTSRTPHLHTVRDLSSDAVATHSRSLGCNTCMRHATGMQFVNVTLNRQHHRPVNIMTLQRSKLTVFNAIVVRDDNR